MAKNIRAIMLPNMSSILISLIAAVTPFDDGVGLLNDRNRMIGWIDILATDPEVRDSHFYKVTLIFNEIINSPRTATQPDWAFLNEDK